MDVTPLQRFVEQASGAVLVLHDVGLAGVAGRLSGDVMRHEMGRPFVDEPGRWSAVLALLADAGQLRTAVSALPRLGRTKNLGCWLAEGGESLLVSAHADWPSVTAFQSRNLKVGGALTTIRFGKFVLANAVLEHLARGSGTTPGGNAGVLVATMDAGVPMDPSTVRVTEPAQASDPALTAPPDVVLGERAETVGAHPVTGRPPVVLSPAELPVPVDEGVLNPIGFQQQVDGPLLRLRRAGADLLLSGDGVEVRLHPQRGASAEMVRAARAHVGVDVDWDGADPRLMAFAVAGLASAGVPLTTVIPAGARRHLGERLCRALNEPASLEDPLRREERSIQMRRAALLEHSTRAWRGKVADSVGVAFHRFPSVSVLLATRRPQMLEHALRQVDKQRGVHVELILATHGFTPDENHVRQHVNGCDVDVVPMPEQAFFGDVLGAALDHASGDIVVKMDDDDWYGPDFLLDLLLAREYTGADLLGTTVEYAYLAPLDRTIRRSDDSERAAKFVAGGSMLLERSFLRELGGFRKVRKYVDAQVLAAVQAMGGHIYRSHGLGYMLRRNSTGHTWDPGLEYYLDEKRMGQQWDGFVPSRILEFTESERP